MIDCEFNPVWYYSFKAYSGPSRLLWERWIPGIQNLFKAKHFPWEISMLHWIAFYSNIVMQWENGELSEQEVTIFGVLIVTNKFNMLCPLSRLGEKDFLLVHISLRAGITFFASLHPPKCLHQCFIINSCLTNFLNAWICKMSSFVKDRA